MRATPTAAKPGSRADDAARARSGRLTAKQEVFVQEYVKDMNAAAAAKRAGYTQQWADKQGSQVLGSPRVQARVAVLVAERRQRCAVDSDFVLNRLIEEVNADAADLYDAEGRLLPVKDWPPAWRRGLVTTIRTKEIWGRGDQRSTQVGVQTDVVLVDRARRLELLGRHIKVNAFAPDKVQLGLDTPLQELFKQISGNVIRPRVEEDARLIEHDATEGLQDERSEDDTTEDDEGSTT